MNSSFINSTILSSTTTAATITTSARYYVEQVQYYFLPILIIFGILGNTLSAYVILKTKLRKLSSSFYLLALATNDSIVLLTIGIQWLREIKVDLYNQPVLCQTITYVGDLCGTLSVWLIVVFTGERFIVVKYPLRSKFLCTVNRAKSIVFFLICLMMLFYSPLLFIVGLEFDSKLNRMICTPKLNWQHAGMIFNSFDLVFTCLIPVNIITILNSVICRKVWTFSRIRRKMTDTFHMETLTEGGRQLNQIKVKADKSSYKMTKMLLIVSTVCLCMILPSYIMRFVVHLANLGLVVIEETFITKQLYVQFLYYLTFGINFGLYCISGQNFRKAVASTFCRKPFKRDAHTATENRTQSSGLFNYQATFRQRKATRSEVSV